MSFYLFLETHDIMEKEKERERKKDEWGDIP